MSSPAEATGTAELLDRWRADLASWQIPEHIAASVTESPWVLPREVFVRRAAHRRSAPHGPSFERAWEALDPPGSVLDIGAGGGAASLPLAPRATSITAVDTEPGMLDAFLAGAEGLDVPLHTVAGRWPDVADQVPAADVVTCHHVLFNVPEVAAFVAALTDHARRRVVVEVPTGHPLVWLNPLWEHFHGVRRPQRPTTDDLLAILTALGLRPRSQRWQRSAEMDYGNFADLVDVTRRRLCLPAERAGEVSDALRELGIAPDRPADVGTAARDLVTIWWDGTARTG
jgi:SAM-dependent methyltransferase